MIVRKGVVVLSFLLPLALASPVKADPIRIGLTITVGYVKGDMTDIFGVPLAPGSVFNGVLTFDPSIPDTNADPLLGIYPSAASVSIDPGSGLTTRLSIAVNDSATNPDLFTASGTPSIPGFFPGGSLFVHFVAPPSAVLGDALPQSEAEFLSAFSTGVFVLGANKPGAPNDGHDEASHELAGRMQATAVTPEPASMLLLGTGLAGLLLRRRRMKR